MVRRDYLLRMVEEFLRMLERLRGLKQARRWTEAGQTLDDEFRRLVGEDSAAVAALSETELLARLMGAGPTHGLRDRTLLLVRLLHEAGDVASANDRQANAHAFHLKSLHLQLHLPEQEESFAVPDFIPRIDVLRKALDGARLPPATHAALMQHYEGTGSFAQAEDELHAVFEAGGISEVLRQFGIAFYRRLLTRSDAELIAGNLPRAEVVEGLRELEQRPARS